MPKLKALCIALVVLLASGTAAFAQPLSDVATYTNWSLKNSINPFNGKKGITQEEATRLPVGALITLPDGSSRALKRGEYVWQLNREYALKHQNAASVPEAKAPAAKPTVATATPAAPKPPPKAVDTVALEQKRIQARYEAEQTTGLYAEDANELRISAEQNLALAEGSAEAAFAASKKSEAGEQATSAKEFADLARKNATEASGVAKAAEEAANATDSARARKNAASARADATATAAVATKAEGVAAHAAKALDAFVIDWTKTSQVVAIFLVTMIWTFALLSFIFTPWLFNAFFKQGLTSKGIASLITLALALPAMLVFRFIDYPVFYREHYLYMYADESDEPAEEIEPEEPEEEPWVRDPHGTAFPGLGRDDIYSAPESAYRAPRVRSPTVQPRRAVGASRSAR